MLDKCVNPECSRPFHYLRDGRVFHVERGSAPPATGKQSHNVEHFWLCGDCCQRMTVRFDADRGVRVAPRRREPGTRAA